MLRLRHYFSDFVWITLVAALAALPVTLWVGRVSTEDAYDWSKNFFARWPFGLLDWLVNFASLTILGSLLVLLIKRYLVRKSRFAPQTTEEPQYRLLDDRAIIPTGSDEFGRTEFVRTLSRTIVLPEKAASLVLALEAAWGAGKTSVLNLLCKELESHPAQPVIVRFNPWLATGRDRIFRAFFSQLTAALLDQGQRVLAERLISFGEALEDLLPAQARILPRLGFQRVRRLVGKIPVIDLETEQERLAHSVEAIGRPIVVIIDDIDRLSPRDIRVMFQLVKAVAALPRVGYLLAFDPKPIDEALCYRGGIKRGREFRDKIVQANITLPRVHYAARNRFFRSRLADRLKLWKFTLDAHEKQLIDRVLPLLLMILKTPRDMTRVLNKTLISAEHLRGEVNFADILALEALHNKYPMVFDLIHRRPEVVNPSGQPDGEITNELAHAWAKAEVAEGRDQNKKGKKLEDFLKLYPHDKNILGPLLEFLFPSIFAAVPVRGDPDAQIARRVSIHQNLLKVLYQGVRGEVFSAQEARDFLEKPAMRAGLAADAVESGALAGWLTHASSFVKSTRIPEASQLILTMARAVNDEYARSRVDLSSDARWPIIAALDGLEESDRWLALEALLSTPDTAVVGEEVLTALLRDAGLWKDGRRLVGQDANRGASSELKWADPVRLEQLRIIWLEAIRRLNVPQLLKEFPNALGVLFRWGQLAEPPYGEVRQHLESAIEHPDTAQAYVLRFPPGIGLEGTEKFLTEKAQHLVRDAARKEDIPAAIRERFEEFFEALGKNATPASE